MYLDRGRGPLDGVCTKRVQRVHIFYLFYFFSIFILIQVFTRWGDSSREGASLSMVFVHKESSVTEGDAVGLDRDARSKIAFPISW